ncbi:caffeine resistance protein [Rhexocercosporidium sp. MPI-PUGE-AT-0058]|nr:caffeine resistance protein [Rhexocercosporidium sp. MPI-PUGE-AT-0058]
MAPQPNQTPNPITQATISSEIEMTADTNIKLSDPFLVSFTLPYDAENPLDWSTTRKWSVTDVLSATGFNRIMVSTIMAPALSTIAKELNMTSAESAMALSIYLLATAFGPLFIGPLSEIYGRRIVLHVSGVWFLVWNIACGFANTKELLIGARFLAGFGASSIYALAGGVLGDVWRSEQRGKSLGIYLLIPLLGGAVGPIIGGFMAARTTWRWMFWSTSIFQAVMIAVSIPTFHETYGPLILQRRAEKLRRETGNPQYYTAHEPLHGDRSPWRILGKALTRPLRLLIFHPIIQITSIVSGFEYGLLYIVLSTFSELWIFQYHQSVEISGLHYIAISLAEIAGSQVAGPLMDLLYRRRKARRGGDPEPETRLPLMILGVIFVPLGLIMYGWTAEYRVHWVVVDVAIILVMFGGQAGGMPLSAYVIDAYPGHTSSAMAAQQFVRSLTAFLFPLFAPKMYTSMGYGWGNTMLGLVALPLWVLPPLFLWKYGKGLRAKAISTY